MRLVGKKIEHGAFGVCDGENQEGWGREAYSSPFSKNRIKNKERLWMSERDE
jgi:hypothetical protein